MRIRFEEWIEENQISEDSMNLFKESISCYRIGAYRSAFIMSYIAFQNILKQRMLDAAFIPTGINQNMWNTICSKLRDEDEWDKQVAECVKRTAPNNIFLIPASTVTLYDGFRCIRNICAHGKSGKIEYFHVEHLWGFIQEHFLKFVVNGGKQGIIKMIEDHYDTTITPVGTDIYYIVNNIKIGIKSDEMDDLLEGLYQICKQEQPYSESFSSRWRQIELWDKLVNESTQSIQEHIITYLKNNHTDEIDAFITRYPHTVDLFMDDNHFLRRLWKEVIFNTWRKAQDGTWIIIEKILDKNVIPETEKNDFYKSFYKFVGKSYPTDKVEILKKTDYFNRLKDALFNPDVYSYPNTYTHANNNARYIVRYWNTFAMDAETVSTINSVISQMQYGPFMDTIHNYLQKDNNWVEFRRILKEQDITDYTTKFDEEL